MKEILIVEDCKDMQQILKIRLCPVRKVYCALSIPGAEKIFAAHPDIAIIAMDGCVPGSQLNTLPLVRKIRETFKGDMIAMSSDSGFRAQLMVAGCNIECEKGHLADLLLKMA